MKFFLLLLIAFLPLMGNSATLEYQVDKPSQLYIGTPFHVRVDITATANDTIYAPRQDTLDAFIIHDIRQTVEETESGEIITHLDLITAGWETGSNEFPKLEFTVTSGDNVQKLTTEPFLISINTVLQDSSATPMDIAAPVWVHLRFMDYALPVFVLAVLIFAIWYLIKFLRRPKEAIEPTAPVDTRPAWVRAMELLEALKTKKLLEQGRFLDFHFELSMILRYFIEYHYGIKAMEMTTSEIRFALSIRDKQEKGWIMDYLSQADKIKFAKHTPTQEISIDALRELERYLTDFGKQPKGE
ncbi:MAG: hypothetical protein K8S56_08970 [Candidatus Cloacimonetes bacterium]|nr:hypothetical protein [Candidatus Cloacimonadota bacterium]